ncbi:hypothetical protein C4577_05015 [Candidatus Parcubacteria bacterium]|nr:MAG: hypothetical protein C4577_05015 [Candidatus Parcubacteria bacterium]
MKYFTRDLLDRFNSDNYDIVEKAQYEWEQAIIDYQKYLDSIWNDLPPSIRMFCKNYCFHDAKILNRTYLENTGLYQLKIEPEHVSEKEKILEFEIKTQNPLVIENPSKPNSYWLYEEFEMIEKDKFKLSILLDDETELEIPFVGDIKAYELLGE